MSNHRKILLIAFVALLSNSNFIYAKSALIIRPQMGYGYYDSPTSQEAGSIYHYGTRILLGAGETQRYGLEVSRFEVDGGGDFIAVGIVLEERLWDFLNLSIGTVGYFGYIESANNPVGLMTNVGWEPRWDKRIKPFITYRNDMIFSEKMDSVYSLSFGVSLEF